MHDSSIIPIVSMVRHTNGIMGNRPVYRGHLGRWTTLARLVVIYELLT